MSINRLSSGSGDIEPKKKPTDPPKEDRGFAKILSESVKNPPNNPNLSESQKRFLAGLSDNFDSQIEHYQKTSKSEDDETYIKMMRYFKENEK